MEVAVHNVSLARTASGPDLFLIVGDARFLVEPEDVERLGLRQDLVRIVDQRVIDAFTDRPLHGPAPVRASDVHHNCPPDFDAPDGRWSYNCTPQMSIVRRDVLAAGWLVPGNPGDAVPYVNNSEPPVTRGVEDLHYNVLLDAVFMERLYGPDGLSSALRYAELSGNPVRANLPLADSAAPLTEPRQIGYNSWFLPVGDNHLHGELNAWHLDDSGHLWSRHYVGRGPAPDQWVNPLEVDRNCWFPFEVLDPEGLGEDLTAGDYVVIRGTLWQDSSHGDTDDDTLTPWDLQGATIGHGGWMEIHPVDWLVRVKSPSTTARLSGRSIAVCCSEPNSTAEAFISVSAEFRPSRPTAELQVRTVRADIDHRFTDPSTVVENSFATLTHHIDTSVKVKETGGRQGRFKGSWLLGWREIDRYDRPWPGMEDGLPPGAQTFGNESWDWRAEDPAPFTGKLAHHSALLDGMHQHYFQGPRMSERTPASRDLMFAHIYLDPHHPPSEVMLQWLTSGPDGWEHRAFWGSDQIPWGVPGTASRRQVGRLPFTGEWVRLECPAAEVGLVGQHVAGMAFSLFGGQATWDYAGVRSPIDPTSDAKFLDVQVPRTMISGQKYGVRFTVKNTGTSAWSTAEGYVIATASPADVGTWGVSRFPCPATASTEVCEIAFEVTAPTDSGAHRFQWQMMQEPERFGEPSAVTVVVVNPDRTVVPDVVELYRDKALPIIAAAQLVAQVTGTDDDDAYVDDQKPDPGTDVAVSSTVRIHLTPGPIP